MNQLPELGLQPSDGEGPGSSGASCLCLGLACGSECPSLPGMPSKMPELQISLMSEEVLFRGPELTMGSAICLHSFFPDVDLTVF